MKAKNEYTGNRTIQISVSSSSCSSSILPVVSKWRICCLISVVVQQQSERVNIMHRLCRRRVVRHSSCKKYNKVGAAVLDSRD